MSGQKYGYTLISILWVNIEQLNSGTFFEKYVNRLVTISLNFAHFSKIGFWGVV